ncbi:hypothetical protein AYJ54_38000 [Bradyrhizobium centrolobii]|uniref:Uncharacterized protein n=1 Tax=Bradyrhizobium centrolobii TaxID=1505087 RepID=A0A176Z6Z2_9BRAD|nr:hypothetical protein AYJ54_38000 [Bradyrhizobium centrolobii]
MTVKCSPGAFRFAIRINMQHDPSNLFPIGAVGLGVKEAPIGHQMLLVISRQHRFTRRDISYIWI